jgi:anti-anti-sigma regulatory factor
MPMIRLTIRSQTPQEAVVQIEGWVSGRNVPILEEEGVRLLGESERLVLDLEGVQFIDEEGIALLKRWSGECLVLQHALPFVRLVLETHGLV